MDANQHIQAPENGKSIPRHRSHGNDSTSRDADDRERGDAAQFETLNLLLKQFQELRAYFSYYVSARTDGVKLTLRNLSLRAALGALGFIAVGGCIVIATWFVLSGSAEGLTVLFGGRPWAGKLLAGISTLAVLGICMYVIAVWQKYSSMKKVVQKYEKRQVEQQEEFGRTVLDQAEVAASETK